MLAAVVAVGLVGCGDRESATADDCERIDAEAARVLKSQEQTPFTYGDSSVTRLQNRGDVVVRLPDELAKYGIDSIVAVRASAWFGSSETSFSGVDLTFRFLYRPADRAVWPLDELTEAAFKGNAAPGPSFSKYTADVLRSKQMAVALNCAAEFH